MNAGDIKVTLTGSDREECLVIELPDGTEALSAALSKLGHDLALEAK